MHANGGGKHGLGQAAQAPRAAQHSAGLATLSGIRLGMGRAQVRAILGKPMLRIPGATALRA